MPLGMSSNSVGAPIATMGQRQFQPMRSGAVPLSAFFVAMASEPDDDALVGFRAPERPEKPGKQGGKRVPPKPKKRSEAVLGPVKFGATHAMTGATSSGNIPKVPTPLGPPLRRAWPEMPTKKRRKRSASERGEWVQRLIFL